MVDPVGLVLIVLVRSKIHRMSGDSASWTPYYMWAVLLHAFFNLFAIMGNFTADVSFFSVVGLILSFLLSWIVFAAIRPSIKRLDQVNGCIN